MPPVKLHDGIIRMPHWIPVLPVPAGEMEYPFQLPEITNDVTMVEAAGMDNDRVFEAIHNDIPRRLLDLGPDNWLSRCGVEFRGTGRVIEIDYAPRAIVPGPAAIQLELAGVRINDEGGPFKSRYRNILPRNIVNLPEVYSVTALQNAQLIPANTNLQGTVTIEQLPGRVAGCSND